MSLFFGFVILLVGWSIIVLLALSLTAAIVFAFVYVGLLAARRARQLLAAQPAER